MDTSETPPIRKILELCVIAHITLFIVGVSWAFGGNADWVRTPISIWGSIGVLPVACAVFSSQMRRLFFPHTLRWIFPLAVLNCIVAVSCLIPGIRAFSYGKEVFIMPLLKPWWIPSAAIPEHTVRALWLFDGIFFSCLNLALTIPRRRSLRLLLAVAVTNAVALSIFGTVQKLAGSTGIYFGRVASPQSMFFASFVYDNHWGAFALLMVGACIGLVIHYSCGPNRDRYFRGPAFTGFVAILLIVVSIVLSGSRSCTLLILTLAAVGVIRGVPKLADAQRNVGFVRPHYFGPILGAVLILAAIWLVAGDVIELRAKTTKEQLTTMLATHSVGSRTTLYRDTWRMAQARIMFGWGMGSFPTIFPLYNTQESKIDRIPVVYHDAHSDWIQSVAELGLAGTLLIGTAALMPLFAIRRLRVPTLSFYLFTGCALVAIYAWFEFPFGNVAVTLGWWLCFFSAVQYTRLTTAQTAEPNN